MFSSILFIGIDIDIDSLSSILFIDIDIDIDVFDIVY
jgi:hypothetical protein